MLWLCAFFFKKKNFVTDYAEFLMRLVALTPRPSTDVIAHSVMTTFCDSAPAKALQFAMMGATSVLSVRSMRRSVTTGKKLQKAVVRLAKLLSGQCKTLSIGKVAKRSKRHICKASSGAELQESVCTSAQLVKVSSGDASDDEHGRMGSHSPIDLIGIWCGAHLGQSICNFADGTFFER